MKVFIYYKAEDDTWNQYSFKDKKITEIWKRKAALSKKLTANTDPIEGKFTLDGKVLQFKDSNIVDPSISDAEKLYTGVVMSKTWNKEGAIWFYNYEKDTWNEIHINNKYPTVVWTRVNEDVEVPEQMLLSIGKMEKQSGSKYTDNQLRITYMQGKNSKMYINQVIIYYDNDMKEYKNDKVMTIEKTSPIYSRSYPYSIMQKGKHILWAEDADKGKYHAFLSVGLGQKYVAAKVSSRRRLEVATGKKMEGYTPAYIEDCPANEISTKLIQPTACSKCVENMGSNDLEKLIAKEGCIAT